MKTPLLTLLASALMLTGCVSGSYETYGYSSSPSGYYRSYSASGYTYPVRPYQQMRFVGPQYYKTYDYTCGDRVYKNYSSAPVVVQRPNHQGGTVIVPRSWD